MRFERLRRWWSAARPSPEDSRAAHEAHCLECLCDAERDPAVPYAEREEAVARLRLGGKSVITPK